MTRRVLIATPSYDGRVGVYYAVMLHDLGLLAKEAGIEFTIRFRAYDSIIERARNDLLREAVDGDFDDMIFIDEDQVFQAAAVLRLLAHPVDLVGFPVRNKNDEERYNVKSAKVPIPRCQKTGLLMPDSVGTGFLRLSRLAIQTAWLKGEPYKDQTTGIWSRWVFDIRPRYALLYGEDVGLNENLRASGILCYLDPAVTIGHVGHKRWDGDFSPWLAKIEGNRSP